MRIAVIGYKDFMDKCSHIIKNIKDIEILPYTAFGSETAEIIKELQGNKTDVIITGQANYYFLKDKTDIPIIILKVDFVDIVSALNEAAQYHPDAVGIAFSSLEDFIFDLEQLCNLIHAKLYKLPYLSAGELEQKIIALKDKGVKVIIGTTLAVSIAEKYGMTGIMIYSVENTFLRSVDKALEIMRIKEDADQRSVRLNTILDNTMEGILSLDAEGRIALFNKTTENILQLKKDILGKSVNELTTELDIAEIVRAGSTVRNKFISLQSVPVALNILSMKMKDKIMGAVLTFQEISGIQKLDADVRRSQKYFGFVAKYTFDDIRGESQKLRETVNIAKKYARNDATVLLYGESGTGKELFAQSIHNYTDRRSFPFVAINCASLPENLLESELFGYDAGAFTGADKKGKKGLFELAHKGTLFLDEIDSIPVGLQGKLLRVLEEKEIIHIGGSTIIPINVRIIASTNKELRKIVDSGGFRNDLFYRINVLKIRISPLRERLEDVPELIRGFIHEINPALSDKLAPYSEEMSAPLMKYDFPGNIRELRSIIYRFLVLLDRGNINKAKLKSMMEFCIHDEIAMDEKSEELQDYKSSVRETEKKLIIDLLNKHRTKTQIAQAMGIGRTTLYRKMKEMRLKMD